MTLTPGPGTSIDRSYRLGDQLGEGGMGTVYRAVHLVNGHTLALKLVSSHLLFDSADEGIMDLHARLALAREFQTLASLHHPNIIRVQSYGFDEQLGSYFTMELLDAPKTILEASRQQPEEVKVRLLAQLLRALSYVHRRGVIHRDIKPGNVLVVDDELKLLDFGIATETPIDSAIAGTVDYMAPEVLLGQAPSIQSDLYSVGIVFFQMLTGTLPVPKASMSSLLDDLLGEDSENNPVDQTSEDVYPQSANPRAMTEFPGPLGVVASKLLMRDPQERYESASVALRNLAAAVPYDLPVETSATRESFLQATVLIGREKEIDQLRAALEQAKGHKGAAFLIGGESGVGKSRLLSEVRTLALVYGYWVAEGQAVTEGGYYYQEWLPLLRALCFRVDVTASEASVLKDLLPNIAGLLGRPVQDPPGAKPEAAVARLNKTILGLLKRLTKPLLLILEDLHWGRSESLTLLAELCKAAPALPVLLVGSYRSDESANLPQTLPGSQVIQLNRLPQQDIAKLSVSMLGPVGQQPELLKYLTRQAEGNVFFLIEVVRALAENAGELERIGQGELPETVLTAGIGRIIERRVDQVSAIYRPLLEFAATLGRQLDLAVLQQVFPRSPIRDFLLECANAAVLESQGSDWRFAHDKLRETILRRMEPDRLQKLHSQVAHAVEKQYVGKEREPFAAVLGFHYREAGIPDKAIVYYLQAGDSAARVYAYEQARSHFAQCAGLVGQLAETVDLRRQQAEILIKQVQCSLSSTPADVNFPRLARARQILNELQSGDAALREDRLWLARIDYYCARLYNYAGQPGQAIPFFRSVLPVASEFKDPELTVVPTIFLALAVGSRGELSKCKALMLPVLEPMERLFGKDIETMRAYMYLFQSEASLGRYQSGVKLIERVLPWVAEVQQEAYSGLFHVLHGNGLLQAGDWPAALSASERSLEMADKIDEPLIRYLAWDINAWANSQLGNHSAALAHRERAVELRRPYRGGVLKEWFEAVEANIYLNAGDVAAALARAQRVATVARGSGNMIALCIAERVWGQALAQLGAPLTEVDTHLKAGLEPALPCGLVMEAIRSELAWGVIYQERGIPAASAEHFQQAQDYMTSELSPYARAEILRIISAREKVRLAALESGPVN